MISERQFQHLAAMEWRERYAALGKIIAEYNATLAPGTVLDTTKFALWLYPGLGDASAADKATFFHWLKVLAKHQPGLTVAATRAPGKGYARGKLVTRYLWGRPFALPSLEDLI